LSYHLEALTLSYNLFQVDAGSLSLLFSFLSLYRSFSLSLSLSSPLSLSLVLAIGSEIGVLNFEALTLSYNLFQVGVLRLQRTIENIIYTNNL